MPTATKAHSRYANQRESKTPPHVSIKYLRLIAGHTIDELIARIQEETGRKYSRGAISAVENGHRGASSELIEAIEIAFGLPVGAIDTSYRPRTSPESAA